MYSTKVGRLDVGRSVRSGGKVVDEWRFISPFASAGNGPLSPKTIVEIAIVKTEKDGVVFEARSTGLKAVLSDSDIESLRQKVEEELRFQHDLYTGVVWEDWLEIQVSGKKTEGTNFWGNQASLKLEYTMLKRGVDRKTGKAYVLNSNHLAMDFPVPKKAGELDPEKLDKYGMGSRRDVESEYSYLPATPENLAGLKDLMARIEELRLRMSAFLNQGTVEQSLANVVSGTLALQAPL